MQNEKWRSEFQDYALLVQAVSNGDRTKVIKLLGDYLLGKSFENAQQTQSDGDTGRSQDDDGINVNRQPSLFNQIRRKKVGSGDEGPSEDKDEGDDDDDEYDET